MYQYCGILGHYPAVQTRMVPGFDRMFLRIQHIENGASSIVLSLETAALLKNREQTTTPQIWDREIILKKWSSTNQLGKKEKKKITLSHTGKCQTTSTQFDYSICKNKG